MKTGTVNTGSRASATWGSKPRREAFDFGFRISDFGLGGAIQERLAAQQGHIACREEMPDRRRRESESTIVNPATGVSNSYRPRQTSQIGSAQSAIRNPQSAIGRGATLIVVMVVLSTLSLMALGLSYRASLGVQVSQFHYEQAYVRQLAQSGLVVAMDRLRQTRPGPDGLGDEWRFRLDVPSQWLDPKGRFADRQVLLVSVVDELGKINIKSAQGQLPLAWTQFDAEVRAAIVDWTDEDNDPAVGGGEREFYRTQSPAYIPKNKPIEEIDELRLVRGMTDGLFFGEDVNHNRQLDANENDGPSSPPLDNADGQLQLGLSDLVTLHGDGKVNVNTAPADVLRAIEGLSPQAVAAILHVRSGDDGQGGTRDDVSFLSVQEMQVKCGLSDFEREVLQKSARFNSTHFRVVTRASLTGSNVSCRIDAVLQRKGKELEVVYYKETIGG